MKRTRRAKVGKAPRDNSASSQSRLRAVLTETLPRPHRAGSLVEVASPGSSQAAKRTASTKAQKAPRRAQDAALARRVAAAFGAQLQQVRRARGWKQDAFGEALGVSRTTASNIERGMQRVFLDQVYRAAAILGVPIDALLPPAHLFAEHAVVHTAADAPLTKEEAQSLARMVQDVIRTVSEEIELKGQRRAARRTVPHTRGD